MWGSYIHGCFSSSRPQLNSVHPPLTEIAYITGSGVQPSMESTYPEIFMLSIAPVLRSKEFHIVNVQQAAIGLRHWGE